MTESLILPLNVGGKQMSLEAKLQVFGYSYRFLILVEDIEVIFERDEEGHFRAMVGPEDRQKSARRLEPSLLQGIAEALEALLK